MSNPQKVLFDDVSASLTYIGKSDAGILTSSALWQIMKITPTEVSYANGTDSFVNIWDNRASYTYS